MENKRVFANDRIEPYQSKIEKGVQILKSSGNVQVARIFTLNEFSTEDALAEVYPLQDRHRILSQIRLTLDMFYVHLEMKRAQYGIDLIRALDRLEPEVDKMTDVEFHQSLVQLIPRMRDRHLTFYGRSPNGLSALLPFLIERCWIQGSEVFVVTAVASEYPFEYLKKGAFITHWNGIPIDRYVLLNANLFDGGNEAAAISRSLEFLTRRDLNSRFLRRFALPIESWVELQFTVDDEVFEERFTWQGFDIGDVPATPPLGRNLVGFGGDPLLLQSQSTKRALFAKESFDEPIVPAAEKSDLGTPTIIGRTRNFQYGHVTTMNGTYAWVRLYHFVADNVDDIANDLIAVLQKVPKEGLIIDIRGNAGGYIAAGERILQMFTPRRITPTRFQFRATEGVKMIMNASSSFDRWKKSIEEALLTGEPFSQGYPIEGTDEDANQIGQVYFGPVVVITDALAFSTADMFVAGFIDHQIGRVIGIDKNMAAAGANNWQFEILRLFIPKFQVNLSFKKELNESFISSDLKTIFNENGLPISSNATILETHSQYGGTFWRIGDGGLQHLVRELPWMNSELNVYPARGAVGLEELPVGISFGLSIRRCIRTGLNEGRLLEDLGIKPNVEHQLTPRDVLGNNEDLLNRAGLELSQMPVYDLDIKTSSANGSVLVLCSCKNITDLEVFHSGRHYASFSIVNSKVSFEVPKSISSIVIKGFNDNSLVARRILDIN